MGSADIQAKIKRGLAKAVSKTGSSSSELVYLSRTETGGTPLNPTTGTTDTILLVNAIFKEYEENVTDVNILSGDRKLVSDDTVAVNRGDFILQGSTKYKVMNVELKAPTSDVLVYISQVRVN